MTYNGECPRPCVPVSLRKSRSEITLQLRLWPPEQRSSAAKLPLGHSGGFLLAHDHKAPLSPECFPEMPQPRPLGGTEGRDRYIRWGRMSDAFASAYIARFIQAPAVFIRCILGNHFALTGTVLS